MKNECNIVRDLLPLCIEDIASPDSAVFVGKHLEKCEDCRREMNRLKAPDLFEQALPDPADAEVFVALQKKIKHRNRILITATTIVSTVILCALLISLIVYHLPQRRQTAMPVCSAAGEVSYLQIDVKYYRRLFSTPWVEGTVTFDGVVYYDINSDWDVYSYWDWDWYLGDTDNAQPSNIIFRTENNDLINILEQQIVFLDTGNRNMFETVIFYCYEEGTDYATHYYGPAQSVEEARQVAEDLGWHFD